MSILDAYLIRQFTGPFLLAVGGFVLIGMVDFLFTLVDWLVNNGVGAWVIARLLLYKMPAIMVLFFPMAVLFSIMLLLVRMAKDTELTVLRTSGVNAIRIVIPLVLICIATSVVAYFINEKVVPRANEVSTKLIEKSLQQAPPPSILQHLFFKDNEERYFYIRQIDKLKGEMQTILIYEPTLAFPRFVTAQSARWDQTTWYLKNGFLMNFNADGQLTDSTAYRDLRIYVDRTIDAFYTTQKTTKDMDSSELKEKIASLSKGGVNTANLQVEYHMKKSLPAACFIFGLIGIGLCLGFVRSSHDWWGVIVSVCAAVLSVGFYFFIVAVFRSLGTSGKLDPWSAAWIPNLAYAFLSGGAILYTSYQR